MMFISYIQIISYILANILASKIYVRFIYSKKTPKTIIQAKSFTDTSIILKEMPLFLMNSENTATLTGCTKSSVFFFFFF